MKRSPEIYLEGNLRQPQVHRLPHGTAVIFTQPWNADESVNQDAAAIIPFGDSDTLLVVADGMGGTRNGAKAAAAAISHLVDSLPQAGDSIQMRTAILDGIEAANGHILKNIPDGGTTLAAVEICGTSIRPYHIGDSSILVSGQRGKLKLNTVDHSPVGFAVEAGVLDEVDALHHDDRHIISNAMGLETMRIELGSPVSLAPHDTVLVASDGLTDNLFLEEIIERIRKGPLENAVATLASLARERMHSQHGTTPAKPDDLTLIAYRRDKSLELSAMKSDQ